jgi:hypothetical protein
MYRIERREEGSFRLFISAAFAGEEAPPLKRWKGDSSSEDGDDLEVKNEVTHGVNC